MKVIHTLIFLLAFSVSAYADDFVIDEYKFTWQVESFGDADLSIEKSTDALKVIVSVEGGLGRSHLFLTPKEATSIGETLKLTEKYYKQQKGTKEDVSKTEKSGDYDVLFSTSVKHGFSVHIREGRSFRVGMLLKRKQARKLAKALIQAEEMAAFLDKKVDY